MIPSTTTTTITITTNKQGFITIPGVENIDPFLLALRFYGFDLWMDRYVESGKRYAIRNLITKFLFYFAILLINIQMLVHLFTSSYSFLNRNDNNNNNNSNIIHNRSNKIINFYSSLDEVRTLILKVTMTFAVNLWFVRLVV